MIEHATAYPMERREGILGIRARAWHRALSARGVKVPKNPDEAERLYPDTAREITRYIEARDRATSDRGRAEARASFDSHCEELATRWLTARGLEVGPTRMITLAEQQARIEAIKRRLRPRPA
jgi:hypothetical protein